MLSSDITIIPYIAVHPDQAIFFQQVIYDNGNKSRYKKGAQNLKNNNNRNKVSAQAEKKIKRAVSYISTIASEKKQYIKHLGYSIKFKLTFVTLTLPSRQIHSDQQIRRDLLHHFLTIAVRKYNIKHYILRSERQVNGNLHFHFICTSFIPYEELRELWNNIINKLGYVDEYRKQMKEYHKNGFKLNLNLLKYWPKKSQKKAYKQGLINDWSNPNTTDIHSLRYITNIKSYLSKYISKQQRKNHIQVKGKEKSHDKNYFKLFPSVSQGAKDFLKNSVCVGRIWSCSTSLSHLSGGTDVIDTEISKELTLVKLSGHSRTFKKEYCEILYFDMELLKSLKCVRLLSILNEFLQQRFSYNIQLDI